ncbi:hypothetical protein BC829DRAFT_407557 [Chytridium lagenaria]|nr:hypothetical protein BC829DRAFT_407557 [Chytridium lagenaria]
MPFESAYHRHVTSIKHVHLIIRNSLDSLIKGYLSAALTFLHSHHHHEDVATFPMLGKVVDMKRFVDDHDTLREVLKKLDAMVEGEIEREVKEMLWPHLQAEEELVTVEFLKTNISEKDVEAADDVILSMVKKEDGSISLPFMRYNMTPEGVTEFWEQLFPWVLRWVIFPWFLEPAHKGYWKYAMYSPA